MNRLALAAILLLAACNNENKTNKTEEKTESAKYTMTEKPFGSFDGKAITEYTISNPSGTQVSIINYGGTITKLIVADKNKNMGDVVLGYDSLSGFLQKSNPYFDAISEAPIAHQVSEPSARK